MDLAVAADTVLPPSSMSSRLMLLRGLALRISTGADSLYADGGVTGGCGALGGWG